MGLELTLKFTGNFMCYGAMEETPGKPEELHSFSVKRLRFIKDYIKNTNAIIGVYREFSDGDNSIVVFVRLLNFGNPSNELKEMFDCMPGDFYN